MVSSKYTKRYHRLPVQIAIAACLWSSTLLSSCIVTESFRFEAEENVPASVISAPSAATLGTSLGQIVEVRLGEGGDGTDAPQERFSVIVRDPNLSQSLEWRVYRDFRPEFATSILAGGDLPPTGTLERILEFSVAHTQLDGTGCHKIELLVSSGFQPDFPQRTPILGGDLSTSVWWLHTTDENTTEVDFLTCP